MRPLLRANIQKSITEEVKPCDWTEYLRVEPEGTPIPVLDPILELSYGPLPRTPWFYVDDDGQVSSCQEPYFGLYALSTMVRSILTAVGFSVAGDRIPEQLYSAAILCYYTSAYHTLTAYLSGQGHVFVSPVLGSPLIAVESDDVTSYGFSDLIKAKSAVDVVCAVLSLNNRWRFDSRRRSHRTRWNELLQLGRFEEIAPAPLQAVADYLSNHGGRPLCPQEEKLRFAIERLPNLRHLAAYEGYGADDFALELAMRGVGGGGTQLRREAMGSLARDWVTEMLIEIAQVLEEIRPLMDSSRADALRMSALRPIEFGRPEESARKAYDTILGFLYGFPRKRGRTES